MNEWETLLREMAKDGYHGPLHVYEIATEDGEPLAEAVGRRALWVALRTLMGDDGEPGPLFVMWRHQGRNRSALASLDERGNVTLRY